LYEAETDLHGFDPNMGIIDCFVLVGKIAVPPIIGSMLQIIVLMTTIYFIGNLNDPEVLAAVGLANMMVNVLAFATTQGLNGALEYYCSQSFGAKQYKECGEWLNRGKFIATCALIPVFLIYVYCDKLLLLLG
jgi:MATE family multidrug resistance protein